MRILMLGWEFPPHFSGGLGIVCYELTKALSAMGVKTTYVMPFGPRKLTADFVDLIVASNMDVDPNIEIETIDAMLTPYATSTQYKEWYGEAILKDPSMKVYSPTLFQEVQRFGLMAELIARKKDFDVIHAHDWLTYPAAMKAKAATKKPLVVHVHATEFDRTGDGGVNQAVYDIERAGMHAADLVVTVSERIKNRCIFQYGVSPEKIRVVYNAVNLSEGPPTHAQIKKTDKIVLFLGRITLQKGPDYFMEAAKKVLDVDPNVKFIMAGSGDMLPRMVQRAAELGIAGKVIFPGFVSRDQATRLYQMADLFIMPSVSEPFGIVPLEAMVQDTPVIISKQSGVSEIISHCIKVDFWDVEEMAEKMLAVLNYRTLHSTMKRHGFEEVWQLNWEKPAQEMKSIYEGLL